MIYDRRRFIHTQGGARLAAFLLVEQLTVTPAQIPTRVRYWVYGNVAAPILAFDSDVNSLPDLLGRKAAITATSATTWRITVTSLDPTGATDEIPPIPVIVTTAGNQSAVTSGPQSFTLAQQTYPATSGYSIVQNLGGFYEGIGTGDLLEPWGRGAIFAGFRRMRNELPNNGGLGDDNIVDTLHWGVVNGAALPLTYLVGPVTDSSNLRQHRFVNYAQDGYTLTPPTSSDDIENIAYRWIQTNLQDESIQGFLGLELTEVVSYFSSWGLSGSNDIFPFWRRYTAYAGNSIYVIEGGSSLVNGGPYSGTGGQYTVTSPLNDTDRTAATLTLAQEYQPSGIVMGVLPTGFDEDDIVSASYHPA